MNSSRPLPFPDRAPLRPDYYLANFRTALDWLSTRYAHLLSDEETSFIATFAALSRPSQALLVRLLMRRGDCFRLADIRYEEIGSIAAAAAPLIELQWLDPSPELQAADLFRLLKLDELRHVFPGLRAGTKKELQARVSAQRHAPRDPGLRLELFVLDLEASVAFYIRVLGFELARHEPGDYANPIEPSGRGGRKIAQAIARAVGAG